MQTQQVPSRNRANSISSRPLKIFAYTSRDTFIIVVFIIIIVAVINQNPRPLF